MDDASTIRDELLASKIVKPTRKPRAKKRKVKSTAERPRKRRTKEEDHVSETEDEKYTGFICPWVPERESSEEPGDLQLLHRHCSSPGKTQPSLLPIKAKSGDKNANKENKKGKQQATVGMVPVVHIDLCESQEASSQDSPKKLRLNLSGFLHTDDRAVSPSSSRRRESSPASHPTPAMGPVVTARRSNSAPESTDKETLKKKRTKTSPSKKQPSAANTIRRNEKVHPLALDLGSLHHGKLKMLKLCPICVRPFAASHAVETRARHMGSCAAEQSIKIEEIDHLIDQESEREERAAEALRRKQEADLTFYDRAVGPSSKPSRTRKPVHQVTFTTLKPAKVGHGGARRAMRELFASLGGRRVASRPKPREDEAEAIMLQDRTNNILGREARHLQHDISLHNFGMIEESEYKFGILPAANSQRPILPTSFSYASQVAQSQSTDPAPDKPLLTGSKLAQKQIRGRRRLGLGIGRLAGWSPPTQVVSQEDVCHPSAVVEANQPECPESKTTALAVEIRDLEKTPTSHRGGMDGEELPETEVLPLEQPGEKQILEDTPLEDSMQIGCMDMAVEEDVDLFMLAYSHGRVLVPCSQ